MQHSEHDRFNSYRPAFLLGGLVSAQRVSHQTQATRIIKPKGSVWRRWFKSTVSRTRVN